MAALEEGDTSCHGKHLILYDGVCGLCNRFIQLILKQDHVNTFRFASLQSSIARKILSKFGHDADDLDTFYVVTSYGTENEGLKYRAGGGLFVLSQLGGLWKLSRVLKFLPLPVLNWGYDLIASNRYRIFGRHDSCPLPDQETRQYFIDQ